MVASPSTRKGGAAAKPVKEAARKANPSTAPRARQPAMQGIRELADMAIDSQARAVTIVRRRIDEDLEEIGKLLGGPPPAQGRRRR